MVLLLELLVQTELVFILETNNLNLLIGYHRKCAEELVEYSRIMEYLIS